MIERLTPFLLFTVKNCDLLTTENNAMFDKRIYFNLEKIFEGYAKIFGTKDNR
ncbi:hypothetical protein SPPR111872_09940 [Sphingobacterium prati]